MQKLTQKEIYLFMVLLSESWKDSPAPPSDHEDILYSKLQQMWREAK